MPFHLMQTKICLVRAGPVTTEESTGLVRISTSSQCLAFQYQANIKIFLASVITTSHTVYPLGERGKALAAADMPRPKRNQTKKSRAVLQTPSLLIDKACHPFPLNLQNSITPKRLELAT